MTGLGKEYGEALYELARDEHSLELMDGQLSDIRDLLRAQPQFIKLLCSRAIERETRIKVVDETFAGRVHVFIVNFMKLLVEKERFDCFQDAVAWFHQRYNEEFGIVEAVVTSAVALSDNDREALRQKLQKMSGRKVTLTARVDPSVIGGVRVEMEGRRYDNTIQNKLGRLKQSMARGL